MSKAGEGRWGSREAEITGVELRRDGQPRTFRVGRARRDPDARARASARQRLRVRRRLFNADGVCCYGTNTHIEGAPRRVRQAKHVVFAIDQLDLVDGHATSWTSPSTGRTACPYDYHRLLYTFRVTSRATKPASFGRRTAGRSRAAFAFLVCEDIGDRHAFTPSTRPRGWRPTSSAHGGRVVFTNGVFDLLHPGHVRYLQDARRSATRFIVGVNSDRSVRANKGPDRPITPRPSAPKCCWRSHASMRSVVFDEDTPHVIISAVQPDVLVKGADWGPDNIVGRDIVEARGGRVVRVELARGFSTTDLISKARSAA